MLPAHRSSPLPSRRNLLAAAGIGGAVIGLAACSSNQPAKPSPAADRSDEWRTLRIDSWETYGNTLGEDFPGIEEFAKQYDVDVSYWKAVTDDNLYYNDVKTRLASGSDIGADAVVLSEWMVARWIRLGYTQQFALDTMPNTVNVRPRFREAAFDPKRMHSMPWRSAITGIAWNRAEFPDGIRSVSQLWDPALKGRVGVLSSMQETIGLIMLDAGVDISGAWGDAEFTAATDTLHQHVVSGQVAAIQDSKYLDALTSGDIVAGFARSADILRLNQAAAARAGSGEAFDEPWGFAIPAAGGVLWTQDLVVPIGSARKGNVEAFVNHYYEPTVAVQVAAATNYVSPVDIRDQEASALDPAVAANRLVFPTPVSLQGTKTFRHLAAAEEQRYIAQYQSVLLAASS
ncbi:extracellular solute-binding protein [Cryobacterium sp. BB307]|uniref:ABC transporter substrate-binding protein n=1 Tax=Cryobacterium sp. BB307 TaxID=2716317 RepID=UPI00144655D1|nr:extracellular solute-binding protein [Cryobacterium sp. BB307]